MSYDLDLSERRRRFAAPRGSDKERRRASALELHFSGSRCNRAVSSTDLAKVCIEGAVTIKSFVRDKIMVRSLAIFAGWVGIASLQPCSYKTTLFTWFLPDFSIC